MTLTIFAVALLGAMVIGVPIAFSLLISSLALMYHLDFFDSQIIAQNLINGANNFPLMAVPFFMLAGEVMTSGGLAKRIVVFALTLVGHFRGGLGYVAIITACMLASLSGSAIADAAALSAVLVPMMVAAGHDKARSAGLMAAGGIIAPVLPPSIAFVIFGVVSGASISKLFMAGIVPGMMLALALTTVWWFEARNSTQSAMPRKTGKEVWAALKDGVWALMLPVIIIVGLRFGFFTPTEAAVVVAVYALFVSMVIYRELKPSQLIDVFAGAAKTTSVVMFLVAAALVASWLITISDLSDNVINLVSPFVDSPRTLMFMILIILLVLGTSLDMPPLILILTPILMPVIHEAGIDPVYFGVIFVISGSISMITPPVGSVLNVVCGVTKLSMEQLFRGVWPFLLAQLAVLGLLVVFPDLVNIPARWLSGG